MFIYLCNSKPDILFLMYLHCVNYVEYPKTPDHFDLQTVDGFPQTPQKCYDNSYIKKNPFLNAHILPQSEV